MPLTFVDVERRKSWRIGIFFAVLLLIYSLAAMSVLLTLSPGVFLFHDRASSVWRFALAAGFAGLAASIHFFISARNSVDRIKRSLGAVSPDSGDDFHRRLVNIVEEVNVVAGGNRRISLSVIPSLSMNALSAVDLKGNAVIFVTEGLVSRLTRAQTEAVVAHEAYHILSGDCLEGTVAASLFGLPSSILEKAKDYSQGRVLVSPPYVFSFLMLKLGYLLNMFISREREYRADAGAVRMTRNPLALAEVLHLLSRNWRGTGFIGDGLEMLCIVNPRVSPLDESEGWVADLLSTHPPLAKRISILLEIAHASVGELESRGDAEPPAEEIPDPYFALDARYTWHGPFSLAELAALPWVSALTWVSESGGSVMKATDLPLLSDLVRARIGAEAEGGTPFTCPVCRCPLVQTDYESTLVHQCRYCGGTMVSNKRVPRILARDGYRCTQRVKALAHATLRDNHAESVARRRTKDSRQVRVSACPKCARDMTRTFFSLAYLVEIDRCSMCGIMWFDQDELEMLQCMVENRMASAPGVGLSTR
ncbi:MAG: M48 family metalloprotease [Thermodesulfovibrionales bacterium]